MSLSAKLRRAPVRIVTGAFILNAGIGKLGGGGETANALHEMASGAYPMLKRVPPKPLRTVVAASEIAVGAGLLLPVVPAGLAGLALVGFSGSLLGMWWRTPGMHKEGSPQPTQQGAAIAKDAWLLGIGTSLIVDAVLDPARNKRLELSTDVKVATARRAAKARSTVKLGRARAEAKAARAAAKAGARARVAKRASQHAFDKVTP